MYDRPPNLFSKAMLFLRSVSAIAASGFEVASDDEISRRAAICTACPHLDRNNVCSQCGCPMEHKVCYAAIKCVLKKW